MTWVRPPVLFQQLSAPISRGSRHLSTQTCTLEIARRPSPMPSSATASVASSACLAAGRSRCCLMHLMNLSARSESIVCLLHATQAVTRSRNAGLPVKTHGL